MNGTISWNAITPTEARGFLTNITLIYENAPRTGNDECPINTQFAKHKVNFTENLYDVITYSIPNLEPDEEYCVAIQASTSAGSSGYTQPIRMSCECHVKSHDV